MVFINNHRKVLIVLAAVLVLGIVLCVTSLGGPKQSEYSKAIDKWVKYTLLAECLKEDYNEPNK